MNMHVNWELLLNYFQKRCSEEELRQIEIWRASDIEHQKFFEEMSEIWKNSGNIVDSYSVDKEKSWMKLSDKLSLEVKPNKGRTFIFKGFIKWAALVLLILAIGLVVKLSSERHYAQNELIIAQTTSDKLEINLPDSTVVTLNKQSKLGYPKAFKGNYREVTLRGTAYFSVKADKTKPFIIKMDKCGVEVVGTSFYLNTDSVLQTVSLLVVSGKVRFFTLGKEDSFQIVSRNEKAVYQEKTGKILKEAMFKPNETVWKTGNFIFEAEKLTDVCDLLTSYYGKKISIKDSVIKEIKLTASFHDRGIGEILKAIETTLDLKVSNDSNVFYISRNTTGE